MKKLYGNSDTEELTSCFTLRLQMTSELLCGGSVLYRLGLNWFPAPHRLLYLPCRLRLFDHGSTKLLFSLWKGDQQMLPG